MNAKNRPINTFLDLSNAIDTLDHDILLHELDFFGINGLAKEMLIVFRSIYVSG